MKKKLLIGIGIFIVVAVAAVFFLNYYLEKEIGAQLKSEFGNLTYDEISVNVLKGNATISKIELEDGKLSLLAEELQVIDISYLDYVFNGAIAIEEFRIIKPRVEINNGKTTAEEAPEENAKEFEQEIKVRFFDVEDATLRIVENDTAVTDNMFLSLKRFNLQDVFLDKSTIKNDIPFNYGAAKVASDSLFYDMDEYLSLTVTEFSFENQALLLNNIKLIPKYSRAQFDRKIPYERDHIDLVIKSVLLNELQWETKRDSLYLQSGKVEIEEADFNIYRNKLLPDDQSIKPMYSEMIRNLGIKLKLDTIEIKNSLIVYEEKVAEDRGPGKLSFSDVEVSIENFSNVGMDAEDFSKLTINAEALFMGESHLTLNMEFDVRDKTDAFHVNGRLAGIRARAINSFLKPTMNVEVEGSIESLYYNFYGNKHEATGNMQMGYKDFKVSILKDNGKEKKSFLSDLANLILKNNAVNEDVKQKDVEATRDKTKSIWNFLWLCIKNGALKTFL